METSNYRARSVPGAALAWPSGQLSIDLDAGRALAQAIVDTIRDPLLVLDQQPACRHCEPRLLSNV